MGRGSQEEEVGAWGHLQGPRESRDRLLEGW